MMKVLRSKDGFTLVELMVVAIIVAILAAVAIPLMSANKKKAYATEAQAGCGAVKTALRVYFAENSAYPASGAASTISGVGAADLDGVYFSTPDYTFTATGSNIVVLATGNSAASTAPQKASVAGITVQLNNNGTWTYGGM